MNSDIHHLKVKLQILDLNKSFNPEVGVNKYFKLDNTEITIKVCNFFWETCLEKTLVSRQ